MTPVLYDGSFDGFLTAVFVVYENKIADADIAVLGTTSANLFANEIIISTDKLLVSRVWKGLELKMSFRARRELYTTFLSEVKGIENTLLRYLRYVFASKNFVENDYSNADVLYVKQTAHKVYREKHRMEAFVRFQKMKDDLYFASVQPDYNVLPLISKHFEERYADQRWLIYDAFRKYGLYYDLETVSEVQFTFSEASANGKDIAAAYDESEAMYQLFWKQYFNSVNIPARKNMKLHVQHMPKRYWKNLVEKQ
jgi:probable DNA metabolism protein